MRVADSEARRKLVARDRQMQAVGAVRRFRRLVEMADDVAHQTRRRLLGAEGQHVLVEEVDARRDERHQAPREGRIAGDPLRHDGVRKMQHRRLRQAARRVLQRPVAEQRFLGQRAAGLGEIEDFLLAVGVEHEHLDGAVRDDVQPGLDRAGLDEDLIGKQVELVIDVLGDGLEHHLLRHVLQDQRRFEQGDFGFAERHGQLHPGNLTFVLSHGAGATATSRMFPARGAASRDGGPPSESAGRIRASRRRTRSRATAAKRALPVRTKPKRRRPRIAEAPRTQGGRLRAYRSPSADAAGRAARTVRCGRVRASAPADGRSRRVGSPRAQTS